ncbi:aldehyde dehydrogenase (plasmid) [Halarchaeum sp. CBA1220]|uniref:aldehyde dehydrogenase family protein n=1 Tax=Halarchaeum sp. CBA1220 TaxID=1853682 RepID=UPI000F3AA659|nr:aldehyde dehydrogenase family protein [Halarchaeum sp. CBA1220]QLC35387.1 aldehyde dehydrogenase [Halarchaeum sp. CBA1220]
MSAPSSADDFLERHRDARADVVDATDPWVDGGRLERAGADATATRDPATGEVLATVPVCDSGAVETAVEAAWDAYDGGWTETTPATRSSRLFEWASRLDDHAEELARLECLDTGKPLADVRGEVAGAVETLEYYASVVRSQTGEQIPAHEDVHLYTRHEPYGVVGQIIPWNFPLWAAAWKLGPALAAGNCAVLKPAEDAPLSVLRAAELSAGVLPDGVLNVVTGPGRPTGEALSGHADVRKVSFTGSVDAGTQVMESAAAHVAPVTLELGGKSPFVVFPDADLDKAVTAAADGVFYGTGEICDAFSRALVHEDVREEFTARFVERARSYALGDPLAEGTTMGPLTSAAQRERVREYVETGVEEGATLRAGGAAPEDAALADGYYVEPTVFTDVENDMRIAREEIFGPVQTIQSFATYEEAIEIANDTPFGLAAGVATESSDLAHHAAADLEAGVVYVNEYGPILPEAPYSGFKRSGIGHDLGEDALDHYRQTKSVYVNLDEPTL